MTTVETRSRDPLAPVREALLGRARQDAEDEVDRARQEAAGVLGRAEDQADRLRAEARAQGEADAEAVLVSARTRARRQARAVVLRAQRELYEELRDRVRRSAEALREDPGYPALRHRLAAQARSALGPDATVTEPAAGGVVAESRGRRFVCTLPDLADQALDAVGTDLDGLWSP